MSMPGVTAVPASPFVVCRERFAICCSSSGFRVLTSRYSHHHRSHLPLLVKWIWKISNWPNPLTRRKRDWIFHHVVAKPQVVKNKISHVSRMALPQVTNGEFYSIPFPPWWRTGILILHTKFWISILHMWGIDMEWFNFSTVETISIPHTWEIDQFHIVEHHIG